MSHLFFAYDSIFLTRALDSNIERLVGTFNRFGAASGHLINFSKSGVLLSANASQEDYEYICAKVGAPMMDKKSKYLNLPSFWGRLKGQALTFIWDRFLSKLRGWKQVFLSQTGREILIKAVVKAIPSFAMSCFYLPNYFCKRLNALVRNFWSGWR